MALQPESTSATQTRRLSPGATVAVVGGGPAGAFFVLHLLAGARARKLPLRVVVFEKNRQEPSGSCFSCGTSWHGCNYCAGGLSPKLCDVLAQMNLSLPDNVVQTRINHLTIQGFWKNIELETPPDRQMLSVFRGARPSGTSRAHQSFDSFLLERAIAAGAEVIGQEVRSVERSTDGKPVVHYGTADRTETLQADFLVFATGVNEKPGANLDAGRVMQSIRSLMPDFVPPPTRRTMIFELEALPGLPANVRDCLFFVEYGSDEVRIEMSSIVPKQHCVTVVLVGAAVDCVENPIQGRALMQAFLKLPHIERLFSHTTQLKGLCFCLPRMVVGSARHPYASRVSAVGDLVTARLYKDGILSAQQTALALAETVLEHGIDEPSLARGYGPTLARFTRDGRFAKLVFLLHRFLFSSSVLSRVLYQAVISERKTSAAGQRPLEHILWRIASGDDDYEKIFWAMLRPGTIWDVAAGALVTCRNYLTELFFGLNWAGFGRFTTGVALERLEEKRREFARLVAEAQLETPAKLEFERMYTIRIDAPPEAILEELENYGEADRQYLKPRGVRILRVAGKPHQPGCIIRYEILFSGIRFHLRFEKIMGNHLAVYRVMDGFARGGLLLFEVERAPRGDSMLSIYVAFNFPKEGRLHERCFWWMFRLLFPAYVHDVLWNHSLCKLKEVVEKEHAQDTTQPEVEYAWQI